jgi:hypothetical protein
LDRRDRSQRRVQAHDGGHLDPKIPTKFIFVNWPPVNFVFRSPELIDVSREG